MGTFPLRPRTPVHALALAPHLCTLLSWGPSPGWKRRLHEPSSLRALSLPTHCFGQAGLVRGSSLPMSANLGSSQKPHHLLSTPAWQFRALVLLAYPPHRGSGNTGFLQALRHAPTSLLWALQCSSCCNVPCHLSRVCWAHPADACVREDVAEFLGLSHQGAHSAVYCQVHLPRAQSLSLPGRPCMWLCCFSCPEAWLSPSGITVPSRCRASGPGYVPTHVTKAEPQRAISGPSLVLWPWKKPRVSGRNTQLSVE